jgi:hypothetical protein
MKHTQHLKVLAGALFVFAVSLSVQAGSLTNNFDYPQNYLLNGVLGDTNWDGVYLGFGDLPNGNAGGSGNGRTLLADGNISFGGFLTVQTTGSDWSGAGDDGFYLWKLVSGDFDVSVESAPVPSWNNVPNNFAGLLVRAFNTNNTGAPVSFTSPTPAENWLALFRCQEFGPTGAGIDEIRVATNAANFEPTFPDSRADTNSTRFYRIMRTSDTFTFYWKTNQVDSWVLITNAAAVDGYVPATGSITRSDWHGQPVQVGIAQAIFSANSPQVYFTDFELTGPGVGFAAPPAAPSNVEVSSPNPAGSVNLSWTPGAGSSGSLVVVRGGFATNLLAVIANPIQGITYLSDTNYGDAKAWIAGSEQVVSVGAANAVTVTGLGGSNNLYNVAVYSYSGSGAATVYNTASPAATNFAGPGIVTNVAFTISPTNIPVGGVGSATIIAKYSTGDSYDVSSDPSATLSSSDPTIVLINSGVMNGITNGTVTITAGYAGASGSASVSVHNPAFTDNLTVSHNYVTQGLAGTPWDGLFLNFGDVPGGNIGPDVVAGQIQSLDANISTNGELALAGLGGTWRSAGDDGPFLFKVLSGDFQVAVHINQMNVLNFNAAGVMARLFNNPLLGPNGGPGGVNGAETHVEWWKIQAGALSRRYTIDGTHTGLLPNSEVAGLANDTWLLMQRVHSTNFLFFEKADGAFPWLPVPAATCVLTEAASNALMEVGISQEMRQATIGTVQFDNLMVDGPGIGSPTGVLPPPPATNLTVTLNNDLSMTFSWVATDATGTNPVRSVLVMRANGPITAQPNAPIGANFGGGSWNFGAGPSLGDSNFVVYVTGNPAASTNVSTTVFGLTPGVTYSAAVYTFVGAGGTKNFANVLPVSGATATQQDGVLLSIEVLPPPPIPLGGLQILQVIGHYQGGATLNISAFANITVGNSNVVLAADGALSGMSMGATSVTAVYQIFTNTVAATVVAPTFTDEFNVNHDYFANRATGSPWDGVYLNQGDIPETGYVGVGQTLAADANVSSNNVLTVTNSNGGWAADQNDGFFLFKYVPGDFQAVVHVLDYQISAYNEAGLLARLYSTGTNGTDIGAPFELGTTTNADGNAFFNAETWVGFTKFDEFNIGTYARKNIDNKEYQFGQNNQNSPDNWLLILRQNLTNFFFYERATNTLPWRLTPAKLSFSGSGALPDFAGQPMQVGIQVTPYLAGLYAQFEHFMLNVESGLILQARIQEGNIILNWPADPKSKLQSTGSLHPSNWQPVLGAPPTLGTNGYSLSLPVAPGGQFFRLVN